MQHFRRRNSRWRKAAVRQTQGHHGPPSATYRRRHRFQVNAGAAASSTEAPDQKRTAVASSRKLDVGNAYQQPGKFQTVVGLSRQKCGNVRVACILFPQCLLTLHQPSVGLRRRRRRSVEESPARTVSRGPDPRPQHHGSHVKSLATKQSAMPAKNAADFFAPSTDPQTAIPVDAEVHQAHSENRCCANGPRLVYIVHEKPHGICRNWSASEG